MFSPARCLSIAVVLVTGCGRFFFDEREPIDGGGDDASGDAFECGHTFCDNFDRSGPPETGWDMYTMTTGTASLASDMSVSPPQSLLISIPTAWLRLTVGGSIVVDKAATHPIGPSTFRLEVGGGISRNGVAPWTVRFDDLTVDVDR